jgi:hypothetical protein
MAAGPITYAELWLQQSDTVKGAVLGAGVAMVGIIVNSLVSGWNTSRQLKHDREQRAAERKMALRREIYLNVAQYFQEGISALLMLPDVSLELREILAAQLKGGPSVAKIHVVAGPKLVEAVAGATNLLVPAILRVRIGRDRLLVMKRPIDQRRKVIEELRAAGTPEATQRAEELAREHDRMFLEFAEQSAALYSQAFSESTQLKAHLVPVIAAIREELDERIDMTVYDRVLRLPAVMDMRTIRQLHGLSADAASKPPSAAA